MARIGVYAKKYRDLLIELFIEAGTYQPNYSIKLNQIIYKRFIKSLVGNSTNKPQPTINTTPLKPGTWNLKE